MGRKLLPGKDSRTVAAEPQRPAAVDRRTAVAAGLGAVTYC